MLLLLDMYMLYDLAILVACELVDHLIVRIVSAILAVIVDLYLLLIRPEWLQTVPLQSLPFPCFGFRYNSLSF